MFVVKASLTFFLILFTMSADSIDAKTCAQEDWTSNPFSKSKYIKGKIVYQKSLNAVQFFSRQFEIHNRNIVIASFEEPAFTSVLPSNDIKALWDLERHTA